ncbi:hypothetical protein GCM10017784_10220 [Deinococcus indicus]|nr:hypothetical protein GCM10017784_10220 [Deinococcus indicus]
MAAPIPPVAPMIRVFMTAVNRTPPTVSVRARTGRPLFIRTPIEWVAKPVQSEQSEWEKNGFRTWSWQSGEVPDCRRNKRNPYQSQDTALCGSRASATTRRT